MKLIEVGQDKKNSLEEFLQHNRASLLQSYYWGMFQEELGKKFWQLVILEKEEIIASALVVKYSLPLNKSYLYCPRGPVLNMKDRELRVETIKLFLEKIKKIAQKDKALFLRIDPDWNNSEENREFVSNFSFKKFKKEVQPKNTLLLDVSRSEEEILKQMHSKTRYNIKLAERKGVKIRISDGSDRDLASFCNLMDKTAARDGFKSHPKEYYKKQLNFFNKRDLIKLFIAELEGEVIASVIVSFYGDNAVYLHGASDYEYRKYMAPYLIQWKAILEAKRRDCLFYDFWGVEGSDSKNKVEGQDWQGITRFKKGFAKKYGLEKNYIGAWDLPLSSLWYGVYNFFKK